MWARTSHREEGCQVNDTLGDRPVIVATELSTARKVIGDESLRWEGTRTALLDVENVSRRITLPHRRRADVKDDT
jgi:hypothetical protein